jgi:hypothetical protein
LDNSDQLFKWKVRILLAANHARLAAADEPPSSYSPCPTYAFPRDKAKWRLIDACPHSPAELVVASIARVGRAFTCGRAVNFLTFRLSAA